MPQLFRAQYEGYRRHHWLVIPVFWPDFTSMQYFKPEASCWIYDHFFKKKKIFSNEVLSTSKCAFFDVYDLEIFDIILA